MVGGLGMVFRSPRSRRARMVAGLCALLVLGGAGCRFAEPTIEPITTEPLQRVEIPPIAGRTAAMDILEIDQTSHLLYATDGVDLGIDVFDISKAPGHYLKTVPLGVIPNGIVLATDLHKLFVGSDAGALIVIDVDPRSPSAYTVVATLPFENAKGPSDLIEYSSKLGRVWLTNPDDGFLNVIDAHTYRLVTQIPNLGLIDQPRYDPGDGMLYVSGTGRNSIIRIDPVTNRVVDEAPIPVTCEPHGLAIDPRTNLGVIGCNDRDDRRALSWNFTTNRMVNSFDQAGGGDAVVFDPVSAHFYFASNGYNPPEVAVFSSSPTPVFLTGVPTSSKSKTVAYDQNQRLIYTWDGRHREAGLWAFPDPLPGYGTGGPLTVRTTTGPEISSTVSATASPPGPPAPPSPSAAPAKPSSPVPPRRRTQ
ncbi:MAG: hypothetical protein NVSMB32_09980 [Actinomycetota bacterium]